MRFFLGLGLFFFAGAICNYFLGRPTPWDEIAGGTAIACFLIAVGLWINRSYRRMEEIIDWTSAHAHELDDMGSYFRDSPWPNRSISRNTKVRSFQMTTSVIFYTHRISIGYTADWVFLRGAFTTCWTLLFGWWAIPWGPGHTVANIIQNLKGGDAIALKDLPGQAQLLRADVHG